MSIIGKPLLAPAGGGISKYFLVNDTLSNGGIIRDIELVDGQPKIQSSKSAVITMAGTTYISPDSEYDALERVDVTISGVEPPTNSILDRTISGSFEDSTITKIGAFAFAFCSNLTNISFPNCTTIGASAFRYCLSLTTTSFPKCTSIDNNAFYQCSNLTTASFPNCNIINSYAFWWCSSLTAVSFPKCSIISDYAFQSCSLLTSVSFPNCITIGSGAFSSCNLLQSVSFPNCVYVNTRGFYNCDSLISIYLPKCSIINQSVFYSCNSLTTVSLPECELISSYAFRYCYNLISLYLMSTSVCTLGINVFVSTPIGGYSTVAGTYGSIYVPSSLLSNYKIATNWSSFSSRFVGI